MLGWYADENSIKKEISQILESLEHGEASYELKYAAKVKESFLKVKLDRSDPQ